MCHDGERPPASNTHCRDPANDASDDEADDAEVATGRSSSIVVFEEETTLQIMTEEDLMNVDRIVNSWRSWGSVEDFEEASDFVLQEEESVVG